MNEYLTVITFLPLNILTPNAGNTRKYLLTLISNGQTYVQWEYWVFLRVGQTEVITSEGTDLWTGPASWSNFSPGGHTLVWADRSEKGSTSSPVTLRGRGRSLPGISIFDIILCRCDEGSEEKSSICWIQHPWTEGMEWIQAIWSSLNLSNYSLRLMDSGLP